MDKQDKKKNLRHRSKKHSVIMLGFAVAAIWLCILLFKILFAHANGESINFLGILDNIWDNILGILPPLILIDLVFEFITQDYVSEEISEQITGTLMSNPETIRLFDNDTKQSFLCATIDSLTSHGKIEAEMAEHAIAPYLRGQYNLKKHFTYNITLRDDPISPLFDLPEYLAVNERLCYEKHYIASEPPGETFSIGFFTCNSDLDKNLRGQDFIFREDLTIRPEELTTLCAMTAEEKLDFVVNDMCLKVYIGHTLCKIVDVSITEVGIHISLRANAGTTGKITHIEVAFCMPRLKTEDIFLVSITEPTYNVNIRLDYPRSAYRVEMYPFFNDINDARVEDLDHGVGSCDVSLRDKWTYPMSGIVFSIKQKSRR